MHKQAQRRAIDCLISIDRVSYLLNPAVRRIASEKAIV